MTRRRASPLDLLEEIRLLANIETDDHKLLSLILAGQPELSDRLNEPSLRQLKQRIALRCELRPLDLRETAAYLAGRIKAAGGTGAQAFTRDAVMAVFEKSGGIPRVISVIADNALVSGLAQQERPVTRKTVLEVCQDFDIGGGEPQEAVPQPAPADVSAPKPVASVAPPPLVIVEKTAVREHAPRGGMLLIDSAQPDADAAEDGRADAEPRKRLFGFLRGR